MSLNTCALSGRVLEQPVLSKKTGHVFEKSLIIKHVETTAQCPITGQEMSPADLVDIVKDNLISTNYTNCGNMTSVLKKVQSEWDTLLLENYQLKKTTGEIKEEISHTLYQHEAANLVICRLIKERDDALRQLNHVRTQLEETNKEEEEEFDKDAEFDYMGIYEDLVERINDLSKDLIAKRRKREVSKGLRKAEELKSFKVKGSYPIHSSAKPGITCIDVHPFHSNLLLTGGIDSRAVIFDINKESTLYSADKTHSKRINAGKFYPSQDILAFTLASADNSLSFLVKEENHLSERYKSTVHKGAVTSASFHPLKEYCLYTSRDMHWSFHSLFKGVCLTKVKTDTEKEICKSDFHPDGLIFATGESNGLVRIWDISSQTAVCTIEAHSTEISGLSFSENGYYLATAGIKDSVVKIVDLRKSEIVRQIELPEKHCEVRSVKFDHSGTYLGIVGSSIHLYNVKTGNIFAEFNEHTDLVTDIAFGRDCDYFATTSLDRNLKIFN